MTSTRIVITLFTKDRPGIVGEVSDLVLAHKGNWLESSLSRLCGLFTGIIHIEVPTDRHNALIKALRGLSQQDIEILVHNNHTGSEDSHEINGLQIVVEANDRPGIVQELADALARENINIDSLDTEVESAAMAGHGIFRAHLFLAMPDDVSEDDLEQILESVSDDVMVSFAE